MTARQPTGQLPLCAVEKPSDDKLDMKSSDVENNFTFITPSLRKIFQTSAQTSEEKYKILDARDKLYKMMRDKDSALKRGALVATCPDMCPEKERLLRDYQGRCSIFEMTNFSKNSSFNHSLAVKEYSRSSADQEEPLPHDLRPVHILTMTMSHLLHNVVDYCELSDENVEEWYMFMWDRTRALRKELTQQEVCNLESVTLVEQCARFHIHCAERLIDQDSSIYDDKINTENLTKCLQTLKYMYKDLAKEDIRCANEPEFICYSLLLNLNNSSVFTELSGMPNSLMTSEPVKFALDVMTTWETKNYIRFFNLVKKTTYLNCCLLRRYFGEMRLYAIKTMIRSYCTKNYSPQILISRFVEILNFEREEECLNFLSYCHFSFHEVKGKTVVNFDRVLFQNPTSTITSGRAFLFIEEKKRRPLSVIMAGETLPPRHFENYIPHNSFTPNGNLDPDTLPQKELVDFFLSSSASSKIESNKSTGLSSDICSESEQAEAIHSPKLQGEEPLWYSLKAKSDSFSTNVFGAPQTSFFGFAPTSSNKTGISFSYTNTGSFGNLFDSPSEAKSVKNIFGNQGSFPLVGNVDADGSKSNAFQNVSFSSAEGQQEKTQTESNNMTSSLSFEKNHCVTVFQNETDSNSTEAKSQEERERNLELEKERILEEEERKKRKEEEEKAKILLEKQRLQEEIDRKEKEKREQDEKREKEQFEKLKKEEQNRRENAAKQEKLTVATAKQLEELKRQEENQRKIELEYKQRVDSKMEDMKAKIQKWKTKIIFEKWRMKVWASIEERKMKEYFKEVKIKYPPVCTEEMLNGNPYGLVIPSALSLEKFRDWKKDFALKTSKKFVIVNDDLPLLKLNYILGKLLENFARSLGSKLSPFPWKLVISVPDSLESPDSWKNIETFVEMHFVEHFSWQFGVQKGPLYCRKGNYGTFTFIISIRKVRGEKLYEGNEPNAFATTGSNALMFFINECGNEFTRERLKAVLKSRAPLPRIPVIVIALNSQFQQDRITELLELKTLEKTYISKYFVIPLFDGKQQPVVQLIKCLKLAAMSSASPTTLRSNTFSTFFSGTWIDSLWRRVEISMSNFKIVLKEPKILIEFYNSCVEELANIFLDKTYNESTVLAEEFLGYEVNLPTRTTVYENRLKSLLDRLKLPHWPDETPTSCHQLNYRIHQYCKKITGRNKSKIKNLKWALYRTIRQSLSWKGLDIYCDEDIREILKNFPWIQVFQKISRLLTRQICEEVKDGKEVILIYDLERIEKFCFESSFISKFLNKRERQLMENSSRPLEGEELNELIPCVEKDSVVYAYTAAIERETNKRKREECVEEDLDALFSSPVGKRIVLEEKESKCSDFSEIKGHLQKLNERLERIEKQMFKNLEALMDFQSKIQ